jgi:hypothetical protein
MCVALVHSNALMPGEFHPYIRRDAGVGHSTRERMAQGVKTLLRELVVSTRLHLAPIDQGFVHQDFKLPR